MPTDYSPSHSYIPFGTTPAVTIDVAAAEQALAYQAPPGGRPPGRIGDHGGPATPTGTPLNANAQPLIDGAGLQKAVFALGLTAALGGAAYLLYQDHAKVSLARNGGGDEAKSKSKKRRGKPQDDEEDDDDDGLPAQEQERKRLSRVRGRWLVPDGQPLCGAVRDRHVRSQPARVDARRAPRRAARR